LVVESDDLDSGAGQDEFVAFWQTMIDVSQQVQITDCLLTRLKDLYTKDTTFKQHLQSHFYKSKSVPSFLTSSILPIATLSTKSFPLTGQKFKSNIISLSPPDSKLHTLQSLSELELALLISAARLDIILDTDTCNFAMVYDEYSSLTSRHKIQTSSMGVAALGSSAKVWGRDVALGAWERLADVGLLIPAGLGGGRDSGKAGRMWKVDVGLEEISGSVEGLSGVMGKWCREI
jgi:origin recognition complex subunit 4